LRLGRYEQLEGELMTDISELMKQAKQMQEKLQAAQQEAALATVEGQAGAGLVRVVMNGKHQVQSIKIDPALLNEDLAVVEDLLAAGVNAAAQKVDENARSSLGDLAGGIKLPEGFKMPF
jgi:DNA-binding YbaB/EbfC family protein